MKTQRKCFLTFLSLFLMIFLLVGVAPLVMAQTQEESEPFVAIGSISGSVVDQGGNPLADAQVELRQCTEMEADSCDSVNWTSVNYTNGTFSFREDWYGQQLSQGIYLVVASAQGYAQNQVDPFYVGDGEDYKLGEIKLVQNPSIGSISGRVVDALTGVGLSGLKDPFTNVELYREQCWDDCYWELVNGTTPNSEGRFTFVSDYPGQLPPGDYKVIASAQKYQTGSKEVGYVGEDDVLKDIVLALEPLPVQFSEKRPCGDLPKEGGTCKYSVRINNRSGKQMQGAAWSIVEGYNIWGDTFFHTFFQTATPIKMTLKPGASRVVNFQFDVPSSVEDGTYICANVWFGENSNQPFFNTLNNENLLCIEKGETDYRLLSQKEAQKLLHDQNRPLQTLQRSKKN